jgi:Tfp pilus assembly protein PilF
MSDRINILAQRIRKDPDDTFSMFALALELIKKQDKDKARTLFHTILKKDPLYVGVYYHLGALYEERGETEQALNVYNEGIKTATEKGDHHAKKELLAAKNSLEMELD